MPCSAMRPSQSLRCSGVAADEDGVAAEERGEHRGGEPDVDAGQPLADPVGVERAAAQPAVLLRDEHQVHTEGVAAHRADCVLRADVLVVELEQPASSGSGLGDELVQ